MEIPSEKTYTKNWLVLLNPHYVTANEYSNPEMERVFSQLNVAKLKLRNRMSAEPVNAILNNRAELKRQYYKACFDYG